MLTATQAMLRSCRQALFRWKVADSTGDAITGGALLTRAFVLRRLMLRELLATNPDDERYIGLLIPPSNGGAIVNAAVTLSGRVTVNLNYSVTSEVLNACIERAGIKHVLTTRKVLEKLSLDINAEVVFLEDFKENITATDKAVAATMAYATPLPLLERMLGLDKTSLDDELTVIFTSGSTGEPKGVVLTHRNIMSNVVGIDQAIHLDAKDVMLGVLPFFHSFGFTVTLWGPLALDLHVAYHFSPLDARQVGKLAGARGATILLATPTFLRSYLKRCTPENFATLDVVVAGAEKLPTPLCDAFEEKFGVRPVEGYGATELAPLVSVNIPPSRKRGDKIDCREGTVGQPVKEVVAKIVHPETCEAVPEGGEGMLLITGPNLMKGYLHDPEKTAKVIRDGWYVTGDIARLDEQGFIHITGRESRFSKIGGEMVPHVLVEEAIQSFLAPHDDDDPVAVVTAVPDEKKGERLIVVHLPIEKTPQEIGVQLAADGLPNLWIPSPDAYMQVDELPLLGSGKLDLKLLAKLALERLG